MKKHILEEIYIKDRTDMVSLSFAQNETAIKDVRAYATCYSFK